MEDTTNDKQWKEKKLMFEIERLESNIELDSRSGYTFFSIMIPLSAGVLGGFLALYSRFDETILPFVLIIMALASVGPLVVAYGIHKQFNWASYKRIKQIRAIEKKLGMENRLLFPLKQRKRWVKIRVLTYFFIYIILYCIIWIILFIGIFFG